MQSLYPLKVDKLGGTSAWTMWFVAELFALMQFSLQLSSGAMVGNLMDTFVLTACGGGLLSSVYYYIYVSLQTPAGMLLDRFGPRRLLGAGALICGAGCLVFAKSEFLVSAIVGRILMGGGAAFAFVGVLTILVRWFPPRRFTLMVALVESLGMIISMMGGVYLAIVIQDLGWRHCMESIGFALILLSPVLLFFIRDEPVLEEILPEQLSKAGRRLPFADFITALKGLLRNKHAWANAGYSGLTFAILTVFGALWGAPFLKIEHHLDLTTAALLANMVFAGAAIGCPLMSYLDNRIQSRSYLLAAGALLTGIFLSLIVFIPELPIPILVILLILTGVCCSTYVINFTVGKEMVSPTLQSTSMGFVNTLSVATAPIFQPLVGLIMDLMLETSGDGLLHYSVSNYQWGISVLIVAQLAAVWLAFKIPARAQNF